MAGKIFFLARSPDAPTTTTLRELVFLWEGGGGDGGQGTKRGSGLVLSAPRARVTGLHNSRPMRMDVGSGQGTDGTLHCPMRMGPRKSWNLRLRHCVPVSAFRPCGHARGLSAPYSLSSLPLTSHWSLGCRRLGQATGSPCHWCPREQWGTRPPEAPV